MTAIGDMVVKARKQRDSDKLQAMASALQDIVFYVNKLEMERDNLYINTRNNYFL